ncbi:MAG: ShlB/FhaC/HecB family hemolysin secretion/activation protein [Bacteroidota bacterium]
MRKKNASRFDFLVGVLPRSNVSPNSGQRNFLITGTFNADMQNQFGVGERLFAEFQQLSPATQQLELHFAYPYILNFPFGIDFKFDLYKQDSSYLQVQSDFGIQYLLEGGNYLKAFWNNQTTNLLTVNESQIIAARRLPADLDVTNSIFGLEYNLQKLDYRFNPRKGWGTVLRAGAGFKRIRENNTILGLQTSDPDFTFQSLYDSLTLRTFQYQLQGRLDKYFPVLQRSTLKASLRAGWIISPNAIFRNEQFRIGGNQILRGFDEESIFTTNYAIGTLEYRLLIGQNSYFFVFGDYGYIEDVTKDTRFFDNPVGVGGGITFETNIGVFGFSLAVGRRRELPFDFRSVKTHFGYVSYF